MSTPATPNPNSTAGAVQAWMGIAAAAIPEVAALVQAILGLRKKYPQMTAADILAAVASITLEADTAFDDVLAKIAADQAAHQIVTMAAALPTK